MRISTKVVFDIETGRVLERISFEYSGPLALAQNARVTQVAKEAVMTSTSANVRVTQVVKEVVISTAQPNVRVTQVSIEAVEGSPNRVRVTQVSIEAVILSGGGGGGGGGSGGTGGCLQQVCWSLRTGLTASQAADQRLHCQRIAIRGINTNMTAGIKVTPRVNGTPQRPITTPALPVGYFDVFVNINMVGVAFDFIISGCGDVEIDSVDPHIVPLAVGVPLSLG